MLLRRTLACAALPLVFATSLASPASARDRRVNPQGLAWLADWDIRAMASSPTPDGGVVRAIAALGDQGAQLVLETFGAADPRNPAFQAHVTSLWVRGQPWNLAQSASAFGHIGFATDGGLDFTVRGPAGEFLCHLNLPAQGSELGARCEFHGAAQPMPVPVVPFDPVVPVPVLPWPPSQPYPHPTQPEPIRPPPSGGAPGGGHHHRPHDPRPSVNWAAQPEVIRACGEAFFGEANESACLDVAMNFRLDPTPIIRTCDQITFGDDSALRCLRAVAGTWFDPSPGMTACDQATFGDENFLRCARSIAAYRYPQAGVVAACDQATFGDEKALECIDIAQAARGDVSGLVKTCDDAMFGDDAALACLRRGVQR